VAAYNQYCALAQALDRIGDRWTMLIVRELLVRPCRYSDLRDALPGIATNLLAERLRRLETDGIVERRELGPPVATTVYGLTDLGRALEPAILSLIRWGGAWMQRRRRGTGFRAHWLGLALRALLEPPPQFDAIVAIVTEGERITLHAKDGEIALRDDDVPVAGELKAAPDVILGIAAGKIRLAQAERDGAAAITGDRRALGRLLRPPAPATQPLRI